jgi:ankyrin repeat protein
MSILDYNEVAYKNVSNALIFGDLDKLIENIGHVVNFYNFGLPLHYAVENTELEFVIVIYEKMFKINNNPKTNGINSINYMGFSPLLLAIKAGKFDNVKYLVENGANINQLEISNAESMPHIYKYLISKRITKTDY